MAELSHLDDSDRPRMVDVSDKAVSRRTARAEGSIALQPETIELIRSNGIRKGNVLITAELAGVQAAKQTANLIPLCHTLTLSKVDVELDLTDNGVTAVSQVKCSGQTGVEMEALAAVSVALLTVYDMCKAVDKNMCIRDIRLIHKSKQ
jgi:cyclic pyranopterin phosphate synthase